MYKMQVSKLTSIKDFKAALCKSAADKNLVKFYYTKEE